MLRNLPHQGMHVQSAFRNAVAMVQDGIAPHDVKGFASCGANVKQQGHIERDMHTWMKMGETLRMEPYDLRLKIRNQRTGGI